MTGESVRSDAAVRATAGRIVTYGGAPAVTYYFSTSGGQTENVEFSFVGALSKPWLVGVPDPYDTQSPYHRWTVRTTAATLDSALGAPGRVQQREGAQAGRLAARRARPGDRHQGLESSLTGPTIRSRLGLRDTWFTFVRVSTQRAPPALGAAGQLGRAPRRRRAGGQFSPAPKRRVLVLERRVGGNWRADPARPHHRVGPLPGEHRARGRLPRARRQGRRPGRPRAVRRAAALPLALGLLLADRALPRDALTRARRAAREPGRIALRVRRRAGRGADRARRADRRAADAHAAAARTVVLRRFATWSCDEHAAALHRRPRRRPARRPQVRTPVLRAPPEAWSARA